MHAKPSGLFVTGTDTGVGKTYVAALIAKSLAAAGKRVGIYKPVESGFACVGDSPHGEQPPRGSDSWILWDAAGQPGDAARVCPQRFSKPVAPHLAARAEGREIDGALLRSGVEYWRHRSEIVLVEGAGGLMSPIGDDEYVADLAMDFGYPLLVVAPNSLGVINQTLQTLITAATFRDGLEVAGIVLNDLSNNSEDTSVDSNYEQLRSRCVPPIVARVARGASDIDANVDWSALAGG